MSLKAGNVTAVTRTLACAVAGPATIHVCTPSFSVEAESVSQSAPPLRESSIRTVCPDGWKSPV